MKPLRSSNPHKTPIPIHYVGVEYWRLRKIHSSSPASSAGWCGDGGGCWSALPLCVDSVKNSTRSRVRVSWSLVAIGVRLLCLLVLPLLGSIDDASLLSGDCGPWWMVEGAAGFGGSDLNSLFLEFGFGGACALCLLSLWSW